MSGELGRASLELQADVAPFERNITSADATSGRLKRTLEALALAGDAAKGALNDVKLGTAQSAISRVSAEGILSGVRGISEEAHDAARELDHVHLSEVQAAETKVAGTAMSRVLNAISRNADQAKRKLVEVRLAGGRNGAGIGPFGSGFGRVGVLGAGVGLAALTAPAAAPGALGLLAGIPAMAAGAAGALGTLILAFKGVGKAIGGDKRAFDELGPAAQKFVLTIRSLDGWFNRLRQTAGAALFPGLTAGLKAALSPGTVNAITTAVAELGHALGMAGAAWGRYFGSPKFQRIFGPLMQSAARNISVLSDTLLHLFDALGVIARAAIPFTNWLTSAIDKGAKFADTWLRAQAASGGLARAMDAAKTSLTLVAKAFGAVFNVIVALGKALYPVSNVALKELTVGLNALAGVIHRNQGLIRDLVGGALQVVVVAVKAAADGIGVLVHGLQRLVGEKATVVLALTAIGAILLSTLGPYSLAIGGVILAVGLIKEHWKTVKAFFINLGHEIVHALQYAWYAIEKGALIAALKVVEPFSHLPSFLGGWARKAKDRMQNQLDRLHPPNMAWGGYAATAGYETGKAWKEAFKLGIAGLEGGVGAIFRRAQRDARSRRSNHPHDPKPGTQSVFGKPPPFKTTGSGSGKPPVIPGTVSHLLALASAQASIASNAQNVKKERAALEKEIADLEKADKILVAKWKHAHGKAKEALFRAITATENKIRAARKKLRGAVGHAQQARIDFALAQAQVAVEKAKQGSKAWDQAIAAEEKALQAEIRYWDKVAHNMKLSADARTAALKKELSYEKQLKALLNETKQAASANIAQFLSSFAAIQDTFGPNGVPLPPGTTAGVSGGSGKTDTHLHDIKSAVRTSNQHLQAIRDQGRFPGSGASQNAAMAVS